MTKKSVLKETSKKQVVAQIWKTAYPTFDTLRNKLNQIHENHEGFTDIELEIDTERGYYDSTTSYLIVTGKRIETDAELDERLAQADHYKKSIEARETAEFERLSKKYGNK